MKNLKFSVPGQMLLMAKTHLTTSFVFMIFFFFTANESNAYKILFGTFGTLGYFLAIYSSASSAYIDDKKTVSPLTPRASKGFILPLILTAISILLIILYNIAWKFGTISDSGLALWAVPLNLLFRLWVTPFQSFLGIDHGSLSTIGYVILFLTPFIASGLGYFAAYKGFDLNAKVHGLMYEKKKEKEKNEF